MKIQAANGYYLPSYFFMKIESNEDIMECITNNEQTFAHEYLHFLQDLILPYNIRNTLVSNRDFTLICSTGFHEKELIRPFEKWDDDSKLTLKQLTYTWGGGEFKNEKERITSIDSQCFKIFTGANVYGYVLTTETGYKYHVGARDFLEYIAHKIEARNWVTSHPVFPYETLDLIFDYYNLGWVNDEVKMCLVEFSLYNDNPMNQLVWIINNFLNKNADILETYEICKNALLRLQWNSTGEFHETIFTKTERRLTDLKKSLSERYANNNFDGIKKWIDHVIAFSANELSNRFIFTELFMLNSSDFKGKISHFIKEIGIPLVFNMNDECVSLLPASYDQNDFVQLYAANKFMDFVLSKQSACQMLDFCKSSRPEILDKNCSENPILRASCDPLCPFGFFVKSYGLHDIQWRLA